MFLDGAAPAPAVAGGHPSMPPSVDEDASSSVSETSPRAARYGGWNGSLPSF